MIWTLRRHIGTTVNVGIASVGMLQWGWGRGGRGALPLGSLGWGRAERTTPEVGGLRVWGPCLHLAVESFKTISGPPLISPVWEFTGLYCQICGRLCFYVCLSIFTAQNWCRGTSRNPESSCVSGQKLENIMTWLKQTPVRENRMLLRWWRSGKNQSGANLEKTTQEHNENNLLAPQKRNQHPPVWWLFPCSIFIISAFLALGKPEPFWAHLLWSHHVQDTRRHNSSHWESRNVLNAEYRWLQFSPPLFHWTHLSIRSTVPQRDTL